MRHLPPMRIDTVDRLQSLSYFRLDKQILFVEKDPTPSPTAARPGRMALTVGREGDRLFDEDTVIYLDAGECVPQCSVRVGA